MFFASNQPEYLEVTYLRTRIVPLSPNDETTLTVESVVETKIVTSKVEDCDNDRAVHVLLKDNILATLKDGTTILQNRKTYRDLRGVEGTTLMKRTETQWDETQWDETPTRYRFKREASLKLVPSITLLSVAPHGASRKRARD